MNLRLFAYSSLQRAGGSRVGRAYHEFLALERSGPARYRFECERRLTRVLSHAIANIPYYRERLSRGATLGDFPIISKSTLHGRYRDFMSDRLRAEVDRPHPRRPGYGWVSVQSGGTTGSPTTVVHDAPFRDAGRASRMYSQYLCGFPLGTPYAMLWGSMRDIRAQRESAPRRILNLLANFQTLNAFQLTDERLDTYLEHLAQRHTRYLMAYVDAADLLARRAIATNRHDVRLESVMACAGTVTDDIRDRIREAFGARTHNKYGSRECTDMACECPNGSIHVFAHHVHLEIVDSSGAPARPGQSGRILVTILGNDAYPLIRYEIGDLGQTLGSGCGCGRPFPTIGQIEGRAVEALTDTRGRYVSPVYFRHLIGVVHNPRALWRRFQVRQHSVNRYTVLLEPSAGVEGEAGPTAIAKIADDLRAVLGADAAVACNVVDRIAEETSGKFLYVVNEMVYRNNAAGPASDG